MILSEHLSICLRILKGMTKPALRMCGFQDGIRTRSSRAIFRQLSVRFSVQPTAFSLRLFNVELVVGKMTVEQGGFLDNFGFTQSCTLYHSTITQKSYSCIWHKRNTIPWRPEFNPRASPVGFILDKVALGRISSSASVSPVSTNPHPCYHALISSFITDAAGNFNFTASLNNTPTLMSYLV